MPSVCPPRRVLSPVEPHLHLPIFISMMPGCPCRAAGDCSVSGSSCCRQQRVPAATIRDCGSPQLLHSLCRAGAPPRLSRRVGGEKSYPQFCLRWIPHASISRMAKFEARESNLRVFSGSHDELSRGCPAQGLLASSRLEFESREGEAERAHTPTSQPRLPWGGSFSRRLVRRTSGAHRPASAGGRRLGGDTEALRGAPRRRAARWASSAIRAC